MTAASKVIEKIVHQQLGVYLEEFNILNNAQSGFRRSYGTAMP